MNYQEQRIQKAVAEKNKRIGERIAVKDRREDSRQTSINISWSLNLAGQTLGAGMGNEVSTGKLEERAREILAIYDKLFEERQPASKDVGEQAL
jgi:hypothetical protein